MARAPRLTAELVARAARALPDRGPPPGQSVLDDADYEALLQRLLAEAGWQGQDLWIYAYGSLLWKPAFEPLQQLPALLHGWHRAFCIRIERFRGSPEEPGLMMSLVRGGCCRGAVQRLAGAEVLPMLRALWRREMTVKPPNSPPRWLRVATPEGEVAAIAFVADRRGRNYLGNLTPEQVADRLSRAAGHWGTGAQYLMETVDQLERLGIRDRNLWRLQQLVAQRLHDG